MPRERWEIRCDALGDEVIFLAFGEKKRRGRPPKGRAADLRIRYRPIGGRGRFATFVLVGGAQGKSIASIVARYNAQQGPVAWR